MAKHIMIVITLALVMVTGSQADVPQLISFQGKLYDSDGDPLTGKYEITFRIYDAESNGTELWSETDSVDCEDGLYNVILGQTTPLSLDFDGQYWLGVQVTGDDELSPRYRLVSVPSAFRAQVANQVSWTNLIDVPVGFADGTDDIGEAGGVSQIDAGTCLEVTNPTGPTATVAHAADASALPDAHHTKTTDASELTSGLLDNAILNMGHGNGIDADMVDGQHASDFLDTANDWGRSGVATDLYEGSAQLSDKYVNETGPEEMTGNSSDPILKAINSGYGPGVYGENSSFGYHGSVGYGEAGVIGTGSDGNWGLLGTANNGVYGHSNSGNGVYGEHSNSGNYGLLGHSSYGVYGLSSSGTALRGESNSGIGMNGTSNSSYGVYGWSSSGIGVYGFSSINWAGYFNGETYMKGNVGIGTESPGFRLDVRSSGTGDVMGVTKSNGNPLFKIRQADDGHCGVYVCDAGGNDKVVIGGAGDTYFNGGDVGIGTESPNQELDINGDIRLSQTGNNYIESLGGVLVDIDNDNNQTNRVFQIGKDGNPVNNVLFRVQENGNVGIGTTGPGYKLDVAGAAHASSFPTSSDARFKTNVTQLTNVLEKLEKIRGVSFQWNQSYESLGRSTGHREIGVIAQEVEDVFPELVTTWGDESYRAVDYGRLTGVLIEAVKEQQNQVKALKAEIDELKVKVK